MNPSTRSFLKSPWMQAVVVVGLLALWMLLWVLPQHFWIPIPPYRRDGLWSSSPFLSSVAYIWACCLLLIPFLLLLTGIVCGVQHFRERGTLRFAGVILAIMSLLPLGIVAAYSLRDFISPRYPYWSTTLPGFSWWPSSMPPSTNAILGLSNLFWSLVLVMFGLQWAMTTPTTKSVDRDSATSDVPSARPTLATRLLICALLLFLVSIVTLFGDFHEVEELTFLVGCAPPLVTLMAVLLCRR